VAARSGDPERPPSGWPRRAATRRLGGACGALTAVALAVAAGADPSLWGTTGLLSIPTAQVQPYASFALGANWVDKHHREGAWGGGTMAQFLTVGLLPEVELSLCATNVNGRLGLQEWERGGSGGYSIDRQASVQWRAMGDGHEGLSLALGSQDFLGMGDLGPGTSNRLYHSSYLVAGTRWRRLEVHAGVGTGRLRGAFGGVEFPLGPRAALIAERDADFTNAGLRVALGPRLKADLALMGLESLAGGLCYTRRL
jgi:hypothetical protein